jgi:hypothetical protein
MATGLASLESALAAAGFAAPYTGRGIVSAEVSARGMTSGSVDCYRLARGFKLASSALTYIGTESSSLTCEEDAAWAASLSAAGADAIGVLCTGDASEHVDWQVHFTVRIDVDT